MFWAGAFAKHKNIVNQGEEKNVRFYTTEPDFYQIVSILSSLASIFDTNRARGRNNAVQHGFRPLPSGTRKCEKKTGEFFLNLNRN